MASDDLIEWTFQVYSATGFLLCSSEPVFISLICFTVIHHSDKWSRWRIADCPFTCIAYAQYKVIREPGILSFATAACHNTNQHQGPPYFATEVRACFAKEPASRNLVDCISTSHLRQLEKLEITKILEQPIQISFPKVDPP